MKNTFEITRDQIKELYEGQSYWNLQKKLEKLFPEAFEPELKTGIWYKSKENCNLLQFLEEIEKGTNCDYYKSYGFGLNREWQNSDNRISDIFKNNMTPATEEEVFERLKEEAVKRGFKKGVTVDRSNIIKTGKELNGSIGKLEWNDFDYGSFGDNCLSCLNTVIYANGVWAEICTPPKNNIMNTYEITFSDGTNKTIKADQHLVIFKEWVGNVNWFIKDNEVIHMFVGVKGIEKL